jgi:hypothetical protein
MRFVFLYMRDFGKNNRTLFIAKLCIIIYNVYDRQFCIINIYIYYFLLFLDLIYVVLSLLILQIV